MKDAHLTLRLPRDLARAVARWARERGVPKSLVVREAVARYLAPAPAPENPARPVPARDLAARWAALPRLTPAEAAALADDIARSRGTLPALRASWE
ncbi:MAG: CopG family transcriptional regulator [Gemmatimonadota bacterium]|jgi:hypothetical protein